MTREEAKQIISDIDKAYRNFTDDEYKALELAIQALSQEPTTPMSTFDIAKQFGIKLEPCDDVISRKEIMKVFTDIPNYTMTTLDVLNIIEQLPSVTHKSGKWIDGVHAIGYREGYKDAQKQKSGKWINDKNDMPICSQCGYIPQYDRAIDDYEYSNYCPNCGARMESEE